VTLGAILSEAGHVVKLSPSGADALGVIRETEFDIVLTDLRLGEVDGMRVLAEVRRIWPETVTLMLTGFATTESAIGALRMGAYDYLCKPFAPEELLATVQRASEHRRLKVQVRRQMRDLEVAIDTARELHSALSARVEGTTALLREREQVLVTVCTELRTSLIAIAGLVDLLLGRTREGHRAVDRDLVGYLEKIRGEAQALAQRVNAAVQVTRSENVVVSANAAAVELTPIAFDGVVA